jgi:hypothetical protein
MLLNKPRIFFLIIAAQFLSVASTCWAQQAAGSTKPAEKPNGMITGRVVNSAGEPLPNAVVYASSLGTSTRSQRATVDTNGDFKVDGLEAGLYRVSAGAPAYVPVPQPSPIDSQSYYRIGDSVTLRLNKGGVISGTVTGPKGPLVAVGVYATRVRDEANKPLTPSMGFHERSTDDRGVYRFYGLLPGGYLISAAKPRIGLIAPSAYDNDTPTYFPSSTRESASEVVVREGEEITADIQYRAEPGHAISGKVVGVVESQTQFSPGASINLTDVRDRSSLVGTSASSNDNFSFAIYGVADGEYELSALQFLQSRDELRSPPRRVTVRGADVNGMILTLAPLASIEGRLVFENDPKTGCGKRRETAAQETIVFGRRYEPEKKANIAKTTPLADVSLSAINYVSTGVGDAKASFTLKNLPPGSYRIDPRPPASGWYVRSIAIRETETVAARAESSVVARDGIVLKSGERVSGITVTITEGAASIRGRISVAAGQILPPGMRLYLVPAERDSSDNLLRFFEGTVANDGTFVMGNLAPGRYWMIAQPAVKSDSNSVKSIKSDGAFRLKVLRDAEAFKNEIAFKPCERTTDYDLPYSPPTLPK